MNINFTFGSSVNSAPVGFTNVFNQVASFFASAFLDPITINISVGYGEVGGKALASGAIGESHIFFNTTSYSQIKSALAADAKSAVDQSAVASLPASDPTGGGHFFISTAEAKALGISNGSGLDGSVGFTANSGLYDFDNSNGVSSGQLDFFGVVAHEVTEIMGRELLVGQTVGSTPNSYVPGDLFHFASAGARTFSGTQAGFFSADNGATNLGNFNTNPGGDFGDWAGSVGADAFLAFAGKGVVLPVSANDIKVMDVLGWDVSSSTPPANTTPPPPADTTPLVTSPAPPASDPISPFTPFTGPRGFGIPFTPTAPVGGTSTPFTPTTPSTPSAPVTDPFSPFTPFRPGIGIAFLASAGDEKFAFPAKGAQNVTSDSHAGAVHLASMFDATGHEDSDPIAHGFLTVTSDGGLGVSADPTHGGAMHTPAPHISADIW
jgi:hypothetical protein